MEYYRFLFHWAFHFKVMSFSIHPSIHLSFIKVWGWHAGFSTLLIYKFNWRIILKGIATSISPDRTRLISILLSNSRLPGHLSPDLWHSMLIILILLIHATTRQQWNASWQSKRRRSAHILSTAIVTVTRNSNGNETGRDSSRRASLPCACVKTVKHSKLHIRFSDAKTVDGYSG